MCRQIDRLEAELRHGNEGLEDERTAETSQRESKAKLGQKPGHLGLNAAVQLSLLRGMVVTLQMPNSELMGRKEREEEEEEQD